MATKRKSTQAVAGGGEDSAGLSWRERIFIREYIDNGNNATQAYLKAWREVKPGYDVAKDGGCRLLTKTYIQEAIATEFIRRQKVLNFDRDKALRIYVGMVLATLDDFSEVFKDPAARENYDGLEELRYALKGGKKTIKYDEDGNETVTVDLQLVDRKAALDTLWERLGLGKVGSAGSFADGLGAVLEVINQVAGRKKE